MREEQELERLWRAVTRLVEAHQEARYVCNEALGARGVIEPGEDDLDDAVQLLETSERLEAALGDVLAILEGASEDVRDLLKEGDE